jgi:quercetin dioxygenase-like cupin family protein
MRHFLKIAEGIDVIPALNALAVNPHLWNAHDLRTTHERSPHKQVDDIWLWFNRLPENEAEIVDDLEAVPYPAWQQLPQFRGIVLDIMRRVEGTRLGRALITRLAPGGVIPAHIDEGAPATYYTRYQLALQCLPGCNFQIGEEVINFRMGEVWQVDNRTEHSVVNNSADDRIVLIVDVRGPAC